MEIIAALAIGWGVYTHLNEPTEVEQLQTQYEVPVTIHVSDNQPTVQWVFIDG
jgi:hypothetical protein